MVEDFGKLFIALLLAGLCLAGGFALTNSMDKMDEPDPVYKCKVTDGREFLAYERHLRKSSGLVKAKGHDGGSTWYDIMVPVIAIDACIKTEQVMP